MSNDWVTHFVCPRCQQRCMRMPGTGDFVHDCPPSASEVLRNEDVLIMGAWVDYTGSDTSVRNALTQGMENSLQGTRAGLEGAKNWPRDSRGYPSLRFRTRRHLEWIPSETFNKAGTNDSMPDTYPNE